MDYMCPICQRDDRTPVIKPMFSVCGHQVCEDCLKTLFRTVTQIQCPICRRPLKRADYSSKYLEEREVEKEIEIRKEVLRVFNKLPEDFPDPEAYNDYLEMVEDLIYDYLIQKNTDIVKSRLKLEEENNVQSIANNMKLIQDDLETLREDAVIEDSIFDESLKDQASKILYDRNNKPEPEELIIHEMPECFNLESVILTQNYDLNTLETHLRSLFLQASGFDSNEISRTSYQELLDGL